MSDPLNVAHDKKVRDDKDNAKKQAATGYEDSPAIVDGDGHYKTPHKDKPAGQPGKKPEQDEEAE